MNCIDVKHQVFPRGKQSAIQSLWNLSDLAPIAWDPISSPYLSAQFLINDIVYMDVFL